MLELREQSGVNKMNCPFSGMKLHASIYDCMNKKTECPHCHKKVKVTIPDPKMHESVVKLANHKED